MKTQWSPVKKNSKVALVCTGSPCFSPEHPPLAKQYLEKNYHLDIRIANETSAIVPPFERAKTFLDYLFNEEIEMIWALRGGEGTADILPFVDIHREKIAQLPPKILMGFSDFTPLLIYFAQHFGWQTIHGPGASQLALKKINSATEKTAMDLLFGLNAKPIHPGLIPLNSLARENRKIEADVIGGNLSLLSISLKDIWEIDTTNKIIIIEDVGEKTHKIGRMLKHLQRIGKFTGPKALIFGDFFALPPGDTENAKRENCDSMQRLLEWFTSELECPAFQTDQFGHAENNRPFIFNTPAILENRQLIF